MHELRGETDPLGLLAMRLSAGGLVAELTARGLRVTSPQVEGCGAEAAGVVVTCRPRPEDGNAPWFYTNWQGPIAPIDNVTDAVVAIRGYLARPGGDVMTAPFSVQVERALAELRRRFPGVCLWWGLYTKHFWALVEQDGRDRLLEAESPQELAWWLERMHSGASAVSDGASHPRGRARDDAPREGMRGSAGSTPPAHGGTGAAVQARPAPAVQPPSALGTQGRSASETREGPAPERTEAQARPGAGMDFPVVQTPLASGVRKRPASGMRESSASEAQARSFPGVQARSVSVMGVPSEPGERGRPASAMQTRPAPEVVASPGLEMQGRPASEMRTGPAPAVWESSVSGARRRPGAGVQERPVSATRMGAVTASGMQARPASGRRVRSASEMQVPSAPGALGRPAPGSRSHPASDVGVLPASEGRTGPGGRRRSAWVGWPSQSGGGRHVAPRRVGFWRRVFGAALVPGR